MKRLRLFAALSVLTSAAFFPLLFQTPAYALGTWTGTNANINGNTVQFDYRGGSATYVDTVPDGSTVSVTINNTIANCIGSCTPIADTWDVSINGQSFSGNTIEQTSVGATVSGQVTITASGIDRGFWGGWYGPIFTVSISSPTPTPSPSSTPEPTASPTPTQTSTPQQ
jgi:hypothetical protein